MAEEEVGAVPTTTSLKLAVDVCATRCDPPPLLLLVSIGEEGVVPPIYGGNTQDRCLWAAFEAETDGDGHDF